MLNRFLTKPIFLKRLFSRFRMRMLDKRLFLTKIAWQFRTKKIKITLKVKMRNRINKIKINKRTTMYPRPRIKVHSKIIAKSFCKKIT